MNAHPNTLSEIVEYSSDAVIPDNAISEITAHHESLHHQVLSEIVVQVQGQATGELTRHEEGKTIDENQFETH
jgi:hypothetical protein